MKLSLIFYKILLVSEIVAKELDLPTSIGLYSGNSLSLNF